VGGEADQPYQTLLGYNNIGNLSGHAIGNIANGGTVPNPGLEPSSAKEFEIGTELTFFKSRLHFDIAYYNKKESREVIPAVTSKTSGYDAVLLNSGTIQNKGIEFLVSGTPVKTQHFSWTETLNVTYNDNKVLSLSNGSSNYPLGYSRAGEDEGNGIAYMSQVVGKSAYQIFALDPARDASGKPIIDPATGAPDPSLADYKDLGSGISPWTTGVTTNLTYKRINLSVLIDGKFGGKIFSGTNYYAYTYGLTKTTLPGRDLKYGTEQLNPQDYYVALSNNGSMFLYDDSFIKLRQIVLGYTFPASMFNNKIQGISLSAFARNVFTIMKHTPNIDPESNYSNGPQGIEQGTVPYTRTFGLNLNVKF
jgi:outer membrane receptor protein involved in Fe transport